MNKFYLFLIMSIGAVFGTAFIFGSTVTSALAQGNETGQVEVGTPLLFTAENTTLPMNNMSNVTTAGGDSSVASETPTAAVPQGGSSSNDDGSSSNDDGSSSNDDGSSSNDDGSSSNDDGSSSNDDGSSSNDKENN